MKIFQECNSDKHYVVKWFDSTMKTVFHLSEAIFVFVISICKMDALHKIILLGMALVITLIVLVLDNKANLKQGFNPDRKDGYLLKLSFPYFMFLIFWIIDVFFFWVAIIFGL